MANSDLLSKINSRLLEKQDDIVANLKRKYSNIDEAILLDIYNTSVSTHQSNKSKNGSFLENYIGNMLSENGISFKTQVTIDNTGMIIGYGIRDKCYHIVDIVVGNCEVGKSITEYSVISCKTTCRERWTQDDWSLTYSPKLYILATLSKDYPVSSRFAESVTRKIVTTTPKAKDDRVYKLSFDNLIAELR